MLVLASMLWLGLPALAIALIIVPAVTLSRISR